MKRIALLLLSVTVLFLLAGCGSGGNSTTTSNTAPGGDISSPGEPIAPGMGRIVVSFGTEAAQKALALALSSNYARVVVRKFDVISYIDPDTGDPYTYNATIFQGIADGTIPGDVMIQVPASTGYQVDILTYAANVDGNGLNAVLKYSTKSGVNVTQGVDNVVSMPSLTDCLPVDALSVPNPVESGLMYDLRKGGVWNYAQPIRNDNVGFVKASTTDFADDWFAYSSSNNHMDKFTAPSYTAPPASSPLYVQGQFFIDTGLLKPSELSKWYNWSCFQKVTTAITPPTNVKITFP